MKPTKAQAELVGKLSSSGLSQSALAKRLGVSQPCVSEWLRGTSRPETHLRTALQIILGINPDDWRTDQESELLATIRKTEAA